MYDWTVIFSDLKTYNVTVYSPIHEPIYKLLGFNFNFRLQIKQEQLCCRPRPT